MTVEKFIKESGIDTRKWYEYITISLNTRALSLRAWRAENVGGQIVANHLSDEDTVTLDFSTGCGMSIEYGSGRIRLWKEV